MQLFFLRLRRREFKSRGNLATMTFQDNHALLARFLLCKTHYTGVPQGLLRLCGVSFDRLRTPPAPGGPVWELVEVNAAPFMPDQLM
ncbi:MAG: hypothetical protein ACOYYJ_12470 [Chloroflexota bacterium]